MGMAEVLHGVAGSAIALMLGVYPELIKSLRSIDKHAVGQLRKKNFASFWKRINGSFLVAITAGILTGICFITPLAAYLELHHFIVFASFLFGFILISAILLLRRVQHWSIRIFFAVSTGALIAYASTLLSPYYTAHNYLFVFIAGALASLSFIIPGVTSAFILVLIGKFQFIITSFNSLKLGILAIFGLGAATALWIGSRFIYKMLADYYSTTVALLAGFMLGSLNRVWPWRKVFEYRTNSKGVQVPALDESILPWNYVATTGKDPMVFHAILMMALGVFIVVLIDKIAAGLKTKL
jgi:putative membrane protein